MGKNNTIREKEEIAERLTLCSAIICVLLGLSLIIFHHIDEFWIILALGIMFCIFGLIHILGYFLHETFRPHNRFDLSFGILNFIIGFIVIFASVKVEEHFSLLIGLMLLFEATTWLQTSLEKKEIDFKKFHIETVFAIVLYICGLIFVLVEFSEHFHGTIYHGISLIIEGSIEILSIVIELIKFKNEKTDNS